MEQHFYKTSMDMRCLLRWLDNEDTYKISLFHWGKKNKDTKGIVADMHGLTWKGRFQI